MAVAPAGGLRDSAPNDRETLHGNISAKKVLAASGKAGHKSFRCLAK
jgi:hypothetical protein